MKNKTSLTLLELLIMIMVFALAAALCLRVFVFSGQLSASDRNKAAAQAAAQNAAELLKAEKGDISSVCDRLGLTMRDETGGSVLVPDGDALRLFYRIKMDVQKDGLLGKAVITVTGEGGDMLCTLNSAWQEDEP